MYPSYLIQELASGTIVSCSLQNFLSPLPLFSCQRNTSVLGRILVVPFFFNPFQQNRQVLARMISTMDHY
jgi:hypothetical protein